MHRRNLFHGFDSKLHFIRHNRSQRMFADLYQRTSRRVSSTAWKIVPKLVFSISETQDYVQEGYRHLWDRLRGYRWVCDCGIRFDTRKSFERHGCCRAPRNTISQYATFVLCRRMKHYRSWHTAHCRDQGKTVHRGSVLVEHQFGTPETIYESRVAAEAIKDLLFLEDDYKIRFAVSSFLEGLSTRDMYERGVDLGYFPSRSYARDWIRKARDRGAFTVYVETLR